MDWVLIGNIIGYIAVAFNIVIFVSNRRGVILIMKLISDCLWATNGVLLSITNPANFTSALLNVIAIGREIVFYYKYNKKWASHMIWLYIFASLTLISPFTSWAGPITLLPTIGSIIAVFAFYSKRPNVIRYLSFVFSIMWLVFGIVVENYPIVICNVLGIISSTIGLILDARAKRLACIDEKGSH